MTVNNLIRLERIHSTNQTTLNIVERIPVCPVSSLTCLETTRICHFEMNKQFQSILLHKTSTVFTFFLQVQASEQTFELILGKSRFSPKMLNNIDLRSHDRANKSAVLCSPIFFLKHPYMLMISVTSKKLPNVYKSCPKMTSLEKLKILTPL